MSISPVQAQWALDATSQVTFSTLAGFLRAASSDNVQALAMMVCEKFGNTLAMSSTTIRKVETIIVPTPPPAVVAFLQCQIGYSPNDCATQLGSTKPGLRFLGLAAALVMSVGPFDGAKALSTMMETSKLDESQDVFIPSIRHLSDILQSVAARSLRCGYQDAVVTWEVLLRETVVPRILASTSNTNGGVSITASSDWHRLLLQGNPPAETIAALVDCFRQVARLGQASVVGVTITVSAGAAWVLAFAQWCLDVPPSLFVDGKAILDPPGSRVKVVIPTSPVTKSVEIITHHKLESFRQLLAPAVQYSTHGMISFQSYSVWILHELGFAAPKDRLLLSQVLEYGIPLIMQNMTCGKFGHLGRTSNLVAHGSAKDPLDLHRLFPLPDITIIAEICGHLLGQETPLCFSMLDDNSRIDELPRVEREQDRRRQNCRCITCGKNTTPERATMKRERACNVEQLFDSVATIFMNIFALSLFESRTTLFLRPILHPQDQNLMRASIYKVLQTGKAEAFDEQELISWARGMIGHTFDDEDQALIVTSARGQVMYPAIYDAYHVERIGYLRMLHFGGSLRYQEETYHTVASPYESDLFDSNSSARSSISDSTDELEPDNTPADRQPANLYQNAVVSWKLATKENYKLETALTVSMPDNGFDKATIPEFFIDALKDTLVYESCSHNRREALPREDRFTTNKPPWTKEIRANNRSFVTIIPVDGSDELRGLALAYTGDGGAVLRRQACLRCCLNLCRDAEANTLIL